MHGRKEGRALQKELLKVIEDSSIVDGLVRTTQSKDVGHSCSFTFDQNLSKGSEGTNWDYFLRLFHKVVRLNI